MINVKESLHNATKLNFFSHIFLNMFQPSILSGAVLFCEFMPDNFQAFNLHLRQFRIKIKGKR